jgi:hypothetical protein
MRLTDATAGPDLTPGERSGKRVMSNNELTIANTPQQIPQLALEGLSQGRFSEVIKAVWGFDPDEVIRAQSLLRHEPGADEFRTKDPASLCWTSLSVMVEKAITRAKSLR